MGHDIQTNKTEEIIVCRDVAEIYCNTITCLNELCKVNSDIMKSLEKLISSISMTNELGTYKLKTLEDEVEFKLHEVKNIANSLPSLKYKVAHENKRILQKHDLSEMEIASAEVCAKESINDIEDNLRYLKEQLNESHENVLGLNFALVRLKSFQCECNALYYGALEGICSFPTESLNIYYELAPRWSNMPNGVTVRSLDKKGFKMYQEMEFNKSQKYLDEASNMIDSHSYNVDNYIKELKKRDVNFFIAGSTSLQHERDIFAGVISLLQTKWKPLGLTINSYSYNNFPREITSGGHQQQYDNFIANHVNVAIFILCGKAQKYTLEEFDVAYSNYKANGAPKIFVYSLNDGINKCDTYIHQKMMQEKQYWIEYKNENELRLLLERDFNSYLINEYSKLATSIL